MISYNLSIDRIKENKDKFLSRAIIIFFACLILLFPLPAFEGAKRGLLLWFNTVLPTLLPFMIVSNLIINTGLANNLGRLLYPVFRLFFRVSSKACYPILIGFLSSTPVGAKTISDLIEREDIGLAEGQYLLSFCNNISPMFILSYIAIGQLYMPSIGLHLFFINYISGIITAFIYFRPKPVSKDLLNKKIKYKLKSQEIDGSLSVSGNPLMFDFSILDKAIMDSFDLLTRVGGYIILFSIPAEIIISSSLINPYIKLFSIGLLEITTAINYISGLDLYFNIKIVLVIAITAFGGLSALAQTNSVIGKTRLSISTYFKNKLIQMLVAIMGGLIFLNLYL